mgnify:CR=1 FL=1
MKSWLSVMLFLFAFAIPAVAQDVDSEYGDTIFLYDDEGVAQKIENCKVQSSTYEQVAFLPRGGKNPSTRSGTDVILVNYGDAPRVYSDGLANLRKGFFKNAITDFDGAKTAVDLGKAGKWLLEYAAVHKAEALLGLAEKDNDPAKAADAVKEFEAALAANEKSLLFPAIQMGLAKAYGVQTKWTEARAAAAKLKAAGEQIRNPIWQAEADRTAAKILLAQGSHTEAVNAYESLSALAQREGRFVKGEARKKKLADLEVEAAVEQGWAMVAWAESSKAASDWTNAESYFDGLAAKYGNNEHVQAAVLNGKGRCELEKDPRTALALFIKAEVVYFVARAEVARALYLKSLALQKLGGARNRSKAEQALKDLKKFYPDSEWARK